MRLSSDRQRMTAVCAGLVFAAIAILVARGGRPVTPVSDTAVLESYTLYASRAQLLVGPYSRYGWHHPGPLYLYLLAPVYTLAGSSTPGLAAGALLINIASIVLVAWVLLRSGGGWTAVLVAASITVYAWRVAPLLVSPWNPHVVVLPLAALAVAAAAVVCGEVRLLPVAIGLASFVIQTHIGVAPTALGICAVMAVAAWRAAPDAIATRRRPLMAAVAVGVALWAVPFAEQASAAPGNMTSIWRFFSSPDRGHQAAATAYAAWSDMATGVVRPDFQLAEGSPFRRSRWRPARTLAAGEMVALAALAFFGRRRRRFEAAFALVQLVALAIAFTAVTRIHDEIIDHEVFWISGLGALAAATIAAGIVSAVIRTENPRRLAAGAVAIAVAAVACIGLSELRAVTQRTFDPEPARRAAAVVGDALERRIRSTGLRPLIQIDQDEWAVAAGALLHLQRKQLPFAVADDWLPMFTEHARATGAETDVIAITGPAGRLLWTGRGGTTIAAADPFYAVALQSKDR